MTKGIYCYIDKKNDEIVYVGRDSNIHRRKRDSDHKAPCNYSSQIINKVVQNNPTRYQYKILFEKDICTDNHLNQLEIYFINKYLPKFNFTKGGRGNSGYQMSNSQKQKLSKINKGKTLSQKTKDKISKTMKKKELIKGIKILCITKQKKNIIILIRSLALSKKDLKEENKFME